MKFNCYEHPLVLWPFGVYRDWLGPLCILNLWFYFFGRWPALSSFACSFLLGICRRFLSNTWWSNFFWLSCFFDLHPTAISLGICLSFVHLLTQKILIYNIKFYDSTFKLFESLCLFIQMFHYERNFPFPRVVILTAKQYNCFYKWNSCFFSFSRQSCNRTTITLELVVNFHYIFRHWQ